MPEPTLPSPKSPPGTSGLEDNSSKGKDKPSSSGKKDQPAPVPPSPQPELEAAEAVAVSGKRPGFRSGQVFLTEADRKLSRHMTRAIARHIGLDPDSNSRSVRV